MHPALRPLPGSGDHQAVMTGAVGGAEPSWGGGKWRGEITEGFQEEVTPEVSFRGTVGCIKPGKAVFSRRKSLRIRTGAKC